MFERNDFDKVRNFMYAHCCGYQKARPRKLIARALNMEDRHFRDISAEIDEIITSAKIGYYILPLVDLTGEETRFARNIVFGEERRRMIALYLRQRRQRAAIKKMEMKEKQREFELVTY